MNNKKIRSKSKRKRIMSSLIIVILIILLSGNVFGRYVLNIVKDYYLRSKRFYFNSDQLGVNETYFSIASWSGVNDYTLTINMNSRENNILVCDYDINYDISCTCSDNAVCTLSKTTGTISSSTNTDFFNIVITPAKQLKINDQVEVEVTAKATSPYTQTLSGKFVLTVGEEIVSYSISDSAKQEYMEVNITNTISFYKVKESFDSYSVGDKIARETYENLSDDNKKKCYSAKIKIEFDPNIIVLDMLNTNYINALNITDTTKNSYNYINSLTFEVSALSSTKVRFYKNDITKDYTYPNSSGGSPIITLTSK